VSSLFLFLYFFISLFFHVWHLSFRGLSARTGYRKNIQCDRLIHLVDNGVLKKVDVGEHCSCFEY
jgi:hypothetical protein